MKISSSDGFNGEFFQKWTIETIAILYKPFKRRQKVSMPPNLFYEASILLTHITRTVQERKITDQFQTLNKTLTNEI